MFVIFRFLSISHKKYLLRSKIPIQYLAHYPMGVKTMIKKITILSFAIGLFLLITGSVFAQFRSDSNTVTTKVGTPINTSSSLAAAASELATTIATACNGAVTGANYATCLQGLSFQNVPNAAAALTLIGNSARDYLCEDSRPEKGSCLQCVGLVQGAVAGTYGSLLNNGGNAKDFATSVPNGYQYISLSSGTAVQEGDIIIKTGGNFGHIAVITKVTSAQTGIEVAEANYNRGGEVVVRPSTLALWDGWLRKL